MTTNPAKTDGGSWSIESLTNRNQLPTVTDVRPLDKTGVEQGAEGADYGLTHHRAIIFADHVQINNNGRSGGGDDWNLAAFLAFTPTAAGKYTLGGTCTFGASATGDSMNWVVFTIDKDKALTVIARGNAKPGDTFNLSDLKDASGKAVASIDVKDGQRIGVTAWQGAEWNWGNMDISGLEIKKAG